MYEENIRAFFAVSFGALSVKFFEYVFQGHFQDPLFPAIFFGAFGVGYFCGMKKKGSILLGFLMSYPLLLEISLKEYFQSNLLSSIASIILLLALIAIATVPFSYLGFIARGYVHRHGFSKTLHNFFKYISAFDAGTRGGAFIGLAFVLVFILGFLINQFETHPLFGKILIFYIWRSDNPFTGLLFVGYLLIIFLTMYTKKLRTVGFFLGVLALIPFVSGGYYYTYFHDKINIFSFGWGSYFRENRELFTVSAYSIWLLFWTTFWGKMFQHFHSHLPGKSSWTKGLFYGLMIWIAMGFLFVFFFFRKSMGYVFDISQWLIYGLLLGRFYEAFSKEADTSVFQILRRIY
jgi:hypothetical protein